MFVQTEFNKSNNNNDLSRGAREQITDGYEELFKDLDLISRFCMPICSRDIEVREVALEIISKTVEGWLDGIGSPKHNRLAERRRLQTSSNGCACSDIVGNGVNDIPKEYLELVTLHLPIILRLSLSCPFVNVREKCQHILEIVQVDEFEVKCFSGLRVNPANGFGGVEKCRINVLIHDHEVILLGAVSKLM
ncbi:hypothetical protein FQA39_LY11047 [Lamprigera yunnana]|nr:hypothetical protein FQA39_LY11047 [Lamprigera yunnana]